MRAASARLLCFASALACAGFGCDTRIVEALDARVTVAVPVPELTVPDGAPSLTADLEVPGFVASPLDVQGGVARGSFSLNVGESARTLTGVLRVRGQLTPADDIATLAVADFAFDAAPGVEANVDDATFTFAPTPERPWLDLNRNGKENRADFEAGCDPAVPIDFIRVSESALQLARDGDRAVVLVDNLLPRAVRIDAVVVDAPGVGVDVVTGVIEPTSFREIRDVEIGAGQTVAIAVTFATADPFFSQGVLSVVARDDIDDDACDHQMSVPVRLLANVAAPLRPADPDAVLPTPPVVAGLPADAVVPVPLENLASGVPLNLDLFAAGTGQVIEVDGAVLAADRVFIVDVDDGARLDVALGAAPVDFDVTVVSLEGGGAGTVLAEAVLPANNAEALTLRNPDDFGGAAGEVLIVVGASGATEANTLPPEEQRAAVSLTARVSRAPQLLTRPDPQSGPVIGGTSVSFTGENLDPAGDVFFGATAATCAFAEAANRTHIVSCETPEGTLTVGENPVDVVYRSPDGAEEATLVDAFRYTPVAPRIDVLDPAVVVVDANTALTIRGFGFLAPTTVTVDGQAIVATVVDDATLFVNLPALAPGTYDVTVTVFDADGAPFATTLAGALLVLAQAVPPPDLAAVFPATGDVAGGTTLNLTGANFSAGAQVFVDDVAADVLFVGGGTILAVTPAGAPGVVTVRVENADGQQSALVDAFTYVVPPQPPPVVFALVPSAGSTVGGESVTVLGAHFDDAATVTLGGVAAAVSSASDGALVVTAPAHAAGVVDVVVENGDGQAATAVDAYSYIAPVVLPPQVFSLTPTTGPTAGGTAVTVFGNRFSSPTVTLDGVAVTLTAQSETALSFLTPAHAAGGGDLVVENADGQSARINGAFAWDDVVVDVRAPAVVDVAPAIAHGRVAGETLRLIGVDLEETVAAAVVVGAARVPATLATVSGALVVVDVDVALPAGDAFVELTDSETGAHVSPAFAVRDPVPTSLDFAGDAIEGGAFSLIVSGSDLHPARLRGVRLTPVDAGSGTELERAPAFESEGVVTVDVAAGDVGRGAWVAALVYEDVDGNEVVVAVDSFVVGGFCPGAALCDTCGNNTVDPGEDCDGVDFAGATCVDSGFDGGVLQCAGCQLDFTLCAVCGNGVVDVGEQCDGANLAAQSCTTRGFQAGTLTCGATCVFDTSACRTCGDGVCSTGETSANCAADCPATCGNGSCQQGTESCDSCPRDCGTCAPYSLVVLGGENQTTTATATFPASVQVRVVDSDGNAVPSVDVSFVVDAGDVANVSVQGGATLGELSVTRVTDQNGEASAQWIAGPRVGEHRMVITAVPRDGAGVLDSPRVVTATATAAPGTIQHVAGRIDSSGALVSALSGLSAIRTSLSAARGVAIDNDGHLLIVEDGRVSRVRLPDGVFEHVAGQANNAVSATNFVGDGGPAALARFRNAEFVAADRQGNLYVTDDNATNGKSRFIRRITPAGIIDTVLGGAEDNANPNDGDGGPPEGVFLEAINGLSVDADDNLLISEVSRVRVFFANATNPTTATLSLSPSRIVGLPGNIITGTLGAAVALTPGVVAVGVTTNSGVLVSSPALVSATGADLPVTTARSADGALCGGPDGALYAASFSNSRILRTDGVGGEVAIAGTGTRTQTNGTGDLGPALSATFDIIRSCAVDAAGDLYFIDNNRVRVLRGATLSTPVVVTTQLRSGGGQTGLTGGTLPANITFDVVSNVSGVASPTRNVLLAFSSTQRGTFAGIDVVTGVTGAAAAVRLGRVFATTTTTADVIAQLSGVYGDVYPSTATTTATIRLPTGAEVTTWMNGTSLQGPGNLNTVGLDFDAGNIFGNPAVAEDGRLILATEGPAAANRGVLVVDGDGVVTRVAGGGTLATSSGDGAAALGASFVQSVTAIEDFDGNIYVSDNVKRVRKIDVNGIVTAFAGGGASTFSGPTDALSFDFESLPLRFALEEDGDLVVGETEGAYIIDAVTHVANKLVDKAACGSGIAIEGNRALVVTSRPNRGGAILVGRVNNVGGTCAVADGIYAFDIANDQLVTTPLRVLSTTGTDNVIAAAVDSDDNIFWVGEIGAARTLHKTTPAGVDTVVGGVTSPVGLAYEHVTDVLLVYDTATSLRVLAP